MKPTSIKLLLIVVQSLFIISNTSAQAPANDFCANAITIVSDSTCKTGGSQLINQTLGASTYTAAQLGSTVSACGFVASQDVWYKFVAKSQYPNISFGNLGSNWGATGSTPKLQLFSGTCGSFTEVACSDNNPITTTPLGTALIVNNIYYIRVLKNNATAPAAANWTFSICVTDQIAKVSRMNELFSRTYLSGANVLNYPWEITYGPDDSLWITESRGYKVYKMSSLNGGKRTVLDLSFGSTWFGATGTGGADTLYAQQSVASWNATGWPQGGFAGLALHPQFGTGASKDFVYVTYVWKYSSASAPNPNGGFWQNKLVRFTYNNTTSRLETPAVIDWNLPGSSDHNSQRLIIAPVVKAGTQYLFMAEGDMGSGQYYNRYRPNNSQNPASYEGKILRFNLDNVGQPGTAYQKWIPSDNPYGASTNAVWSTGIRNNQGFAYDTATNILYGTSHGPYSDDEINIIQGFTNYGHPRVVGYAADGNYNGTTTAGLNTSVTAGAPFTDDNAGLWYVPTGYIPPASYTSPYFGKSSIAPIGNELTNVNTINASAATAGAYKDPLFSAYPTVASTILSTWQTNPGNGGWESEAWSGLDLYSNTKIPGWKRSLVTAGLKWGRLVKLNLNNTGTATMPSGIGGAVGNAGDTITYFQSTNRYRDLAFGPNGKDIFLVMDNSSATSGPGTANPSASGCPGCVIKYTFLGYADAGGFSTLPKSIAVSTSPTLNSCVSASQVTIDATNNAMWVPITGTDGNIVAEINAMGQNLGLVTTSFYQKAQNTNRVKVGVRYLDRNITITPANNVFATPVKIRLYISKAEFDALKNDPLSGIAAITDLRIHKNNDACSGAIGLNTTLLTPTNTALVDLQHGANGYVLQSAVSSFSSFYFAGSTAVLPVDLVSFTGKLQPNLTSLLKWSTSTEINTAGFDIERSEDGISYSKINYVKAIGNSSVNVDYSIKDNEAVNQNSNILYYRLKIINNDGSFKYSNIVTINMPYKKALVTIAPNPVLDDIKGIIISPITGNVTLKIYDNVGRLILNTTTFVRVGNNAFVQKTNLLASGLYFLDIEADGIISTRVKFQKQ